MRTDYLIKTSVSIFISQFGTLFNLFCISSAHAHDVRTVKLNQMKVAKVFVSPGRSTILSFPTKPTKVILGNQGVFAVEYVENDLAIAALSSHSHSDLFAYLEGRRFAFDLVAVPSNGDTIVLVRDSAEEIEVSNDVSEEQKSGSQKIKSYPVYVQEKKVRSNSHD